MSGHSPARLLVSSSPGISSSVNVSNDGPQTFALVTKDPVRRGDEDHEPLLDEQEDGYLSSIPFAFTIRLGNAIGLREAVSLWHDQEPRAFPLHATTMISSRVVIAYTMFRGIDGLERTVLVDGISFESSAYDINSVQEFSVPSERVVTLLYNELVELQVYFVPPTTSLLHEDKVNGHYALLKDGNLVCSASIPLGPLLSDIEGSHQHIPWTIKGWLDKDSIGSVEVFLFREGVSIEELQVACSHQDSGFLSIEMGSDGCNRTIQSTVIEELELDLAYAEKDQDRRSGGAAASKIAASDLAAFGYGNKDQKDCDDETSAEGKRGINESDVEDDEVDDNNDDDVYGSSSGSSRSSGDSDTDDNDKSKNLSTIMASLSSLLNNFNGDGNGNGSAAGEHADDCSMERKKVPPICAESSPSTTFVISDSGERMPRCKDSADVATSPLILEATTICESETACTGIGCQTDTCSNEKHNENINSTAPSEMRESVDSDSAMDVPLDCSSSSSTSESEVVPGKGNSAADTPTFSSAGELSTGRMLIQRRLGPREVSILRSTRNFSNATISTTAAGTSDTSSSPETTVSSSFNRSNGARMSDIMHSYLRRRGRGSFSSSNSSSSSRYSSSDDSSSSLEQSI